MTPTLLHAVARKAEAITPDADLLARYLREQDHSAFEELLRRHGPMVWSVCRQMLPHHADAEDAFQAVFLALVRSAASIRDGRTVPAWLHGVAVRIATRVKRDFARRRARERAAALPEADQSVSDEAWESLVAAVHEEVQKLPEAERTAFVLCELQGVSQADAAARLGWPLGSVSGRLCKARQRLLDHLAARGVVPSAAVGIGITAGAARAVPEGVFELVKSFPSAPAAASTAATVLARGLVEGMTMRVKLMAAAMVVVAAFGVTGGAVVLSKAEAQPPVAAAGAPPSAPKPPTPPAPATPPPLYGTPGAGNGIVAWHVAPVTWEYKFVDIKNDRKTYESTITQHGKDGWEFCSSERFGQGELVLVFKKRKGVALGMPNVPAVPAVPGGVWRDGRFDFDLNLPSGAGGKDVEVLSLRMKNANVAEVAAAVKKAFPKDVTVIVEPQAKMIVVVGSPAAMKDISKIIQELDAKGAKTAPTPPVAVPSTPNVYGPTGLTSKTAGALNVLNLKHATAEEMVAVLKTLFPNAEMTADPRTNAIIVRADDKTLDELKMLLTRLDVEVSKPK